VAREWNTPTREPWNGVIKTALDTVDQHNAHYFQSNDARHLIAAELLRTYVTYLKDLVLSLEKTAVKNIKELEEDQKYSLK
jgi:hypothetical protein